MDYIPFPHPLAISTWVGVASGLGGRQLVSWDGGRLGFACAVGVVLSSRSWGPGPGRAAAHVGEHGPSGRCPPLLRSDLEGVESGWGDGDPVRRRKGVHVRTGALGGRQPGSVFVGTRAQWWES